MKVKPLSEITRKDLKRFKRKDRKAIKRLQEAQPASLSDGTTVGDPDVIIPKAKSGQFVMPRVPRGFRPQDGLRAMGIGKKARKRMGF